MILLNNKIISEYQKINWKEIKLNKNLSELISSGFIDNDDCFFLKSLYNIQTNAEKDKFIDKTGYECFINSIHIDDYIDYEYIAQACLLLKSIFAQWNKLNRAYILNGIISQTDFGANLKFHISRHNEIWLDEKDIDNFEEGIIIVTSDNTEWIYH